MHQTQCVVTAVMSATLGCMDLHSLTTVSAHSVNVVCGQCAAFRLHPLPGLPGNGQGSSVRGWRWLRGRRRRRPGS